MPIVWRRQMSLGNTTVDNDHKYLIYLINSFERSINLFDNTANLVVALKQLEEYANIHFNREEQFQERLGFPGLDHHRRCHDRMKEDLKTLIADLASGNSTKKKRMDSTQFIEFLRGWLIDHIIKEDLSIKPYING